MVLAGGAGRRFSGAPKGLEIVGGRRIIDAVVGALRGVTQDLILAANDPTADTWLPGEPIVRDVHERAGGLAGVEAALRSAHAPGVIVVAWDMPFVTAELLAAILRAARTHEAEIVVPESDSPYGFEPFCAFYSAAIRSELGAFLDAGGGAARDFVRQVERVHRIPIADIARIGDPKRLFFSVNTLDDLERARDLAG